MNPTAFQQMCGKCQLPSSDDSNQSMTFVHLSNPLDLYTLDLGSQLYECL